MTRRERAHRPTPGGLPRVGPLARHGCGVLLAIVFAGGLAPAVSARVFRASTFLLSAGPLGGPGNGPSITPSVDHDGRVVAFATVATNLLAGATGDAQIVRAAMTASVPQLEWVSKSADRDQVANGPSYDPSITDGGEWIFFDSTAGNIGGSEGWHNADAEPAGRRQVYRWTVPQLATTADITHVALESRGGPDGYIFSSRTAAWNEDTSARGNYLTFESEDPGIDPDVPGSGEPPWYPGHPVELNLENWLQPYLTPLPTAPQSEVTEALPGADGTPDDTPGSPSADPRAPGLRPLPRLRRLTCVRPA